MRGDLLRHLVSLRARSVWGVLAGSLACFVLAYAGMSAPVLANTIAVTNLNDSGAGSLRQAIAVAEPNDTITVPAGQITLTTGALAFSKNLTITGAGSGATVISGNDASRVFTITGTPTVTLGGLTVTHGKDPMGAGINVTGTLTLNDVIVSGNHAGGGGVAGFGGGISVGPGTLGLTNSAVTENTAGGGTKGAGFGGGIDFGPGANGQSFALTLTRSQVSGNRAGGGGTESEGFGAGVEASTGFDSGSISIALSDSVLSGNVAGGSGAESPGFGGGVDIGSGGKNNVLALTLDRVALTGNTAGGGTQSAGVGGGINFSSGGSGVTQTLTVTNSTIAANSAGGGTGSNGFGGGIAFGSGAARLAYVTVAGNSAGGGGGSSFGGGLNMGTASSVGSSIIAANFGGNCSPTVTSAGHNVEDAASCGFTGAGDKSGVDAKLGPLANHGGLTSTQMPLAGSPAIDAGDPATCLTTDQRGVLRPQGAACDIGAVEVAPPAVVTGPASGVGAAAATVGGSVNPNFSETSYHVDFGTATGYGSSTASAGAGAGGAAQAVSTALTGLKSRTLYHYRLVATNAAGTTLGGDQTLTTGGTTGTQSPTARPIAPTFNSASITNKRFRVGKKNTAISAKKAPIGTSFRFTLSAAAKVQITITRSASGLRRGHNCVAPTKSLRRAHAKRCTRTLKMGTLTRASEPKGADHIAFSGRIGARALSPRSYKAILSASNAGGRSTPVTLSFIIVH
jgi:hypothetical protein